MTSRIFQLGRRCAHQEQELVMSEGADTGIWRDLYLGFIRELPGRSVLELGSGSPSFLSSLPTTVTRRLGVDGNRALAPLYAEASIEFQTVDLDKEAPPIVLADFDIAVCSDVFEHLLYPERALQMLRNALKDGGILFSHVPNEFTVRKMLRIMMGFRTAVYRRSSEEWSETHLRRFTDVGYRRFLQRQFRFNVKITDLRYRGPARMIDFWRLPVPYCLEGGPTYASTNAPAVHDQLLRLKRALKRRGLGL
jgi:SAM-dependent methyltransferase